MTNALLHPFSPPVKPEADYLEIVRGEGSLVFDVDGKGYVDGIANLWLCQVGHGRTEIIDAVTEQMHRIEAYNTFAPFTNGPAAEVAEMIVERSPHPDGRVFLGCSGSEAVDTALKLARLVQQRRGQEGRQVMIRRTNGYHGTNFGGTSAQGIALNREGWGDLVPHFIEVPHDDLEAAATVFAEHGERIAAVLTEPVQGAGGVHPPVDGYLEGLRHLCDDNGALLIFDEVICGFGRTGSWFGAQTFGVTPDLMTFAKGVTSGYQPLSGVTVSLSVCSELEEPGFLLRTGYTYSGHQASCAAGIANIELMEAEGLVDRVDSIGERLRAGLTALEGDGLLESWRGMGAIYAAELGRDAVSARDKMLEAGVIVRPMGTCLAICPPLVITDDEIGRIIDAMADALR
ncbi:MAG: aminotransferase class III-fold pyridoxal phosphate-dependent enzyme [Acidimicrobiales bacterium]|mgnify:FL=1|jgi:adenosylmethionine-8-amino-7-oxononanoate aminotransferase|nr:aminotransferase class III-fold pyridoxal phosphate-dependent enzyme [Acidimicrobiales bacterium]MDP7410384.1 aminotransferase class III-fold pyridoxal phosphate-dependent enzyme [Acidimicrobiales bacterium]MEE1522622.1 aminotransferase class III-fold pyridoxal phosphate-dependent enzyme [Acidimicrobiales bacterium]MEE1570226.1 aminotransferase class III-fold pyridoxal phosphate-dependent enzyme [Acidimicrobiales bacterium]|tara:strand:- start:12046 stop:13251 length:1206 start_codon:yes stop_codon:yes gene_type:complete